MHEIGTFVHGMSVDLNDVGQTWNTHGFVILPGFIPADELAPVLHSEIIGSRVAASTVVADQGAGLMEAAEG
jgi:hypothetical protein